MVYTLKPHVGKFKKRGFGPCIVEEMSLSGAVKLSTLDGEIMSNWISNWISGCQIKKYELPLKNGMLEQMHAAKNRIKAIKIQKVEAQAEAKERIQRIKQRQAIIATILPQEQDLTAQHP